MRFDVLFGEHVLHVLHVLPWAACASMGFYVLFARFRSRFHSFRPHHSTRKLLARVLFENRRIA